MGTRAGGEIVTFGPDSGRQITASFLCLHGMPYKPKRKREVIDWKEVRAYPHLGGECFDSLYLGIKMEPEKRERIIVEARKCNPAIKVFQMTMDPDAFRLKEEIIRE